MFTYSEKDRAYSFICDYSTMWIKRTTRSLSVGQYKVPAGTLMVWDTAKSVMYFIVRFPYVDEKGVFHTSIKTLRYDMVSNAYFMTFSARNPELSRHEKALYDFLLDTFRCGNFPAGCLPCNSVIKMREKRENYNAIMQDAIRRHKHGTGGRPISRHPENDLGSLRYKQVTEAAYWANLYSMKSGNASVVAANIR